jgi:hypothetical protein
MIYNKLYKILNLKTIIVTVSSVVSTAICIKFNITAKFPDFLIGIAIVFPVVFSISSAFGRREFALQRLSDLKGHLISLYFTLLQKIGLQRLAIINYIKK